ncbi:uncharacterized protein LOC105784844 [Gossypium raimondii]|uniref:uncharacterized protein LOC105784844 n=1 Tax=Gossypium raimondii TaxID=29730 RepID=UPI00063B0320|nr:uncharacterized protein LOC105784844 [Gossypium raimondii]
MTGYIDNDQLLIHCFQDSLIGAAAKWYNQLGRTQICSWKDLAQAFMGQYSHVADMTSDRITLQNMEKKQNESFRQYAQRWREVATQVQPPLLEKETIMLLINTLKAPFITHMLGSATMSFSDIVMIGEMIENAVRNGKIDAGENSKRPNSRKKEGEVNNVSAYNNGYSKPITVDPLRMVATSHQGPLRQESNSRSERPQFTPISITYKELYQNLFDARVVAYFYLKPMQPPFPKWYDTNAQCEYHAGITGHLIKNCTAFKKVVERLIKMGIVKLDDPSGPNVARNPLPNHSNKWVNEVSKDGSRRIKVDVMEVRALMKYVWDQMVYRGLITRDLDEKPKEARMYCEFHAKEGHNIQECAEFRTVVQNLMDNKEIEFYEGNKKFEAREVCASEEGPAERFQKVNHPVVIISRPRNNEAGIQVPPKVIIQKPVPFL